jgi:hypothetical protein
MEMTMMEPSTHLLRDDFTWEGRVPSGIHVVQWNLEYFVEQETA